LPTVSMMPCSHDLLQHDNEEGEKTVGRNMTAPVLPVTRHDDDDENRAPQSAHWRELGGSYLWGRMEGVQYLPFCGRRRPGWRSPPARATPGSKACASCIDKFTRNGSLGLQMDVPSGPCGSASPEAWLIKRPSVSMAILAS
jgi:hypothetical protein